MVVLRGAVACSSRSCLHQQSVVAAPPSSKEIVVITIILPTGLSMAFSKQLLMNALVQLSR